MDSCKLGTCDALKQAEARVRELEATIDAMAEAHAHDDQALTAAYLSGAHAGKKQAEAERDALREALKDLLAASHPVIHRGRHACAGRVRAKRLARVALAATEVPHV